ncbi:hypothetical protein FOA43_001860 [Brettanomyces nanus]|uniref:Uncharacterized protein n=1 Tax=Eeniella nana TaxID=13502 RepID=A0A875RP39_EENNA|nr:uncharacterized protein FOA43_001860 [Brettanomyces nanus]QPG74530.1 hypothetical protein FOA43_001860 [Brettanomyces nanus]
MLQITSLWSGYRPRYQSHRVDQIFPLITSSNISISYLISHGYLDHLWTNFNRDVPSSHILSVVYILNGSDWCVQSHYLNIYLNRSNIATFRELIYAVLRLLDSGTTDPQLLEFLFNLVLRIPSVPSLSTLLEPLFSILAWKTLNYQSLVSGDDLLKQALDSKLDQFNRASHSDKEDLYLSINWFGHLLSQTIAVSSADFKEASLRLIVAIISYIPTRRYTNTIIRETAFVYRFRKQNSTSLWLPWLEYFINYPINDFSGETYVADPTELFNRLASLAYSQFNLDTLIQHTDPARLCIDYEEFKKCFVGKIELKDLQKLAKAIKCRPHSEFDHIVLDIWYHIGDFTPKLPLTFPSMTGSTNFVVPVTPSFIDEQDFVRRSVLTLRKELENSLHGFYDGVSKRLSIPNGSSKFAADISSPPIFSEDTSVLQRPKLSVNVIVDFKGRNNGVESEWKSLKVGDLVYLVKANAEKNTCIPAIFSKCNAHDHRTKSLLLIIDKDADEDSDDLKNASFVVRLTEDAQKLACKYANMVQIATSLDFSISSWLMKALQDRKTATSISHLSILKNVDIILDEKLFVETHSSKRSKSAQSKVDRSDLSDPLMLELSAEADNIVQSWTKVSVLDRKDEASNVKLDYFQSQALLSGLLPGITVIEGAINAGKSTIVGALLHMLMENFSDERVLVLVGSEQSKSRILQKCTLPSRLVVDLAHSNTLSDYYFDLLNQVQLLATALKTDGTFGSNYESALFFYHHYMSKKWSQYLTKLKENPKSLVEDYPFDKKEVSHLRKLPIEKALTEVLTLYNEKLELFRQLDQMKYHEEIHGTESLKQLTISKYSKVILATEEELIRKEFDIKGVNSILLFDAEQFNVADIMLIRHLENVKRVTIVGNPSGSQGRSLLTYFEADRRHFKLGTQYGMQKDIFQLGGQELSLRNPIKHAGTGFKFAVQFVEVSDAIELERSGQFENVSEAEWLVCMYRYMLLMGYKRTDICILTTYKLQKILLSEVFQSNEELQRMNAAIPVIFTPKELCSRKFKYVLVSSVRTSSKDVPLISLTSLCNCTTEGLYIFGSIEVYGNLLHSVLKNNGGKLQLVVQSSKSYEVQDLKHFERLTGQMEKKERVEEAK